MVRGIRSERDRRERQPQRNPIRALHDFDDDVRGYAARALGRIGAPDALPALNATLQDENDSVRREAESAIRSIRESRSDVSRVPPTIVHGCGIPYCLNAFD